eukprot:11348617-Alexandrium_andersonii.AAC.1
MVGGLSAGYATSLGHCWALTSGFRGLRRALNGFARGKAHSEVGYVSSLSPAVLRPPCKST